MRTLQERFARKITCEPNSGCWLWVGCTDACGYGRISVQNVNRTAHRVSWELHVGDIPEALQVLHKCDVRCCVNPRHLFLGTHDDNMEDARVKGKMGPKTDRRSTCKRGHPYTGEMRFNSIRGKSTRFCRECSNLIRRQEFKGG